MFLFSCSNCLFAALRAGYCPPCLKSVLLSVWLLLFLFLSRCPGKVIGALARSTLVFTIPSSSPLSDIKASDVLMNFQSKADQQFTTNFITCTETQTDAHAQVHLQPHKEAANCGSLSVIPAIPICLSHCTTRSQSATPLAN